MIQIQNIFYLACEFLELSLFDLKLFSFLTSGDFAATSTRADVPDSSTDNPPTSSSAIQEMMMKALQLQMIGQESGTAVSNRSDSLANTSSSHSDKEVSSVLASSCRPTPSASQHEQCHSLSSYAASEKCLFRKLIHLWLLFTINYELWVTLNVKKLVVKLLIILGRKERVAQILPLMMTPLLPDCTGATARADTVGMPSVSTPTCPTTTTVSGTSVRTASLSTPSSHSIPRDTRN